MGTLSPNHPTFMCQPSGVHYTVNPKRQEYNIGAGENGNDIRCDAALYLAVFGKVPKP